MRWKRILLICCIICVFTVILTECGGQDQKASNQKENQIIYLENGVLNFHIKPLVIWSFETVKVKFFDGRVFFFRNDQFAQSMKLEKLVSFAKIKVGPLFSGKLVNSGRYMYTISECWVNNKNELECTLDEISEELGGRYLIARFRFMRPDGVDSEKRASFSYGVGLESKEGFSYSDIPLLNVRYLEALTIHIEDEEEIKKIKARIEELFNGSSLKLPEIAEMFEKWRRQS